MRLGGELSEDRQVAISSRAWPGNEAIGDLALHHQTHATDESGVLNEMMKDGRGDVIRQIAENITLFALETVAKTGKVGQEDVSFQDCNIWLEGEFGLQVPSQITVQFESDDLLGAGREQFGQGPTPRTDLADQIVRPDRQGCDDALLEAPVAQEMLAKLGTDHVTRF